MRNVNAIVLFIQENRSSTVYLHLFTGQSSPLQYGSEVGMLQQQAEAVNRASQRLCIYVYGGDGNVYSEIDRSTTNHAANIR